MTGKKIFTDEEFVDLFCKYLVLSFRKYNKTGMGFDENESASLVDELVEAKGKDCYPPFKMKIGKLGDIVFQHILAKPELREQYYDTLIKDEPDNSDIILQNLQFLVFNFLKSKNLIEGNSKSFERIKDKKNSSREKLEDNKIENHVEKFIGTCSSSILGILRMQFSLLTHVKDVEQNHFSIGYVFGLVDGLMQIKNVDIDDDIALSVMTSVLDGQYTKEQAREVLSTYEKQTKHQNSVLMLGLQAGGEDIFAQMANDESPMGLCAYFDDKLE